MPIPPDRLPIVDALRGFALFGILVVNLYGFALPLGADPASAARGPLDHVAVFLTHALFESKFYVLFSFLFGFGLAMQIERAQEDPPRLRPRYFRRLTGLFILGALHAALLFAGDILVSYALLGLVLWRLRSWQEWRLERFAIGMIGVACIMGALIGTSFGLAPDPGSAPGLTLTAEPALAPVTALAPVPALAPDPAPDSSSLTNATTSAPVAADAPPRDAQGIPPANRRDFGSAFAQRMEDLALIYLFAPLATWPGALAMFVFGLLAGRTRALASPAALMELVGLRWPAIAAVAVLGNLVYALCARGSGHPLLSALAFGILPIAGPLLALIYAQALWVLMERRPEALLARALQAAGRLSLTNYLGQSIACAILFEGYGFQLYGRPGPAALLGLALLLYAAQLALSLLWLRSFRLGPAEWLLRLLTYGPRNA